MRAVFNKVVLVDTGIKYLLCMKMVFDTIALMKIGSY